VLGALASVAATWGSNPARAQTRTSIDAGLSYVAYRDFLPAAAFSLTPALDLGNSRAHLAVRGTWLVFETGNTSLQGTATASLLIPPSPRLFSAFAAELGGSRYESFAHFSHALARARVGLVRAGPGTAWIGAAAGVAASDSTRGMVQGTGAYQLQRRAFSLMVSGTATAIGPTHYADFETTLSHGRAGDVQVAVTLSARATDPDRDAGPYGEAAITIPLTPAAALVLGGGRFAVDPVRGNVAGHYATAALRVALPTRRPLPLAREPLSDSLAGEVGTVAATLIDLHCSRARSCTLVFRAVNATAVQLMGDFTDWLPSGLQPTKAGTWSITLPITPGRHRLNVRVNGGSWGIPGGVTPVNDDFQGLVGTIVVP
jgi:hypothetical protein